MIAVVVEFYPIADKIDKLFCIIKYRVGKFARNVRRNVGRVTCFNVKTVQHRAFAYPVGELIIEQSRLLAKPCQVVTVKEMMRLVQQERLERLFHSLLAVENDLLIKPPVIDKDFCGQKILICVVKPVIITFAVSFVAVVSAHKA